MFNVNACLKWRPIWLIWCFKCENSVTCWYAEALWLDGLSVTILCFQYFDFFSSRSNSNIVPDLRTEKWMIQQVYELTPDCKFEHHLFIQQFRTREREREIQTIQLYCVHRLYFKLQTINNKLLTMMNLILIWQLTLTKIDVNLYKVQANLAHTHTYTLLQNYLPCVCHNRISACGDLFHCLYFQYKKGEKKTKKDPKKILA